MSEKISVLKLKADLLKEINFYFQSPKISLEEKQEVVKDLQEILDKLKKFQG